MAKSPQFRPPQYSRENNDEFRRLYEASGLTKPKVAEAIKASLSSVISWTKAETSKSSFLCPDWAVSALREVNRAAREKRKAKQ